LKRFDYIKEKMTIEEMAKKAVFRSVTFSGILYVSRLTNFVYRSREEAIADNMKFLEQEVKG
jgi:hypothetical protein